MKNGALRYGLIAAAALTSSMFPTNWLAAQTLRSEVDPTTVQRTINIDIGVLEVGQSRAGIKKVDSIGVKQKLQEREVPPGGWVLDQSSATRNGKRTPGPGVQMRTQSRLNWEGPASANPAGRSSANPNSVPGGPTGLFTVFDGDN